jgi:hypothetical protein
MKKTFLLTDPIKKPERIADAIKFEVKKYLKRERNKTVPENVDYWDFDCAIGASAKEAQKIEIKEISSRIDEFVKQERESFYLEILAKPGYKSRKP